MFREPWRTRLLFLSLAANVFLGGVLAAHLIMRPGHLHGPEAGLERLAHDLPPADAARFRAKMAERRADRDAAHDRMEAARLTLSRAIGRVPYDEAAVRQAMADWQDSRTAFSNQVSASILATLATLSPDGRARLAEVGRRPPPPP